MSSSSVLPSSGSAPRLVLRARGIDKSFSGVSVLRQVSFDIAAGEIHTLLGENGAGKSTLMKIIAGVHAPDRGELRLDGQPVHFSSPHAAMKAGIALIHQEPLSFPDLSIAENIFIGQGLPRRSWGPIHWRKMREQARTQLDALGVKLHPQRKMAGLSIADQQMVELAAALSLQARILLMDEPTAALTPREVEELFRIVRRLKSQGVAVVFISHRLPEVFQISDRITVLRDGEMAGERKVTETTPGEIVKLMVGRPLEAMYEKAACVPGSVLLETRSLGVNGLFRDISLSLRAGEIVGLAGLVGAGRTQVAETLFGLHRAQAGKVLVEGKEVALRSPAQALRQRIAYVPEDRARHGLLLAMNIRENTTLADLSRFATLGFIRKGKERAHTESWRTKLHMRLHDIAQAAQELSGGNQQKVVLAKWLQTEPKILIVDEPTRGIDVGAKAEVHHLLAELARQGHALLMISSDLPEVLAMSDRVLVMRQGRLAAEFPRAAATQEKIMAAATGVETALSTDPAADSSPQSPAASLPSALPIARPVGHSLAPFRELGILALVVLAYAGVCLAQPRFWSWETARDIAMYIPIILIVATGQLMVMVSRNIDLSVGSMLGLSAFIACSIFARQPEFPLWAATLAAMAVGAGLGAVNGLLVAFGRVPAIVATLGTLTAYRGLIFMYSGGKQIDPQNLPVELLAWSRAGWWGVPWILWIAAGVAALGGLFLRYARMGRYVYALGSNPKAAALRGLPVRGTTMLVFILTGMLAGLGGMAFGSRFGVINPTSVGDSLELVVISAVVIGGAAVSGGAGTMLGTFLGCLLLGIINIALTMLQISEFWQMAIYGAAIVLAAMMDAFITRAGRRKTAGGAA